MLFKYLLLVILVFPFSALAGKVVNNYTQTDTVGQFAPAGYIGNFAKLKTISEAHEFCLLKSSNGAFSSNKSDTDYYQNYKICMSQYVPFKKTGTGSSGSCVGATLTWGQCSAFAPTSIGGAIVTLKNSLNTVDFEGVSSFQCNNSKWEYQGGGCGRAVHACKVGAVVSWAVTNPLWADESLSTVFKDWYGQVRHTPKSRCLAKMPKGLSGEIHIVSPTVPEMVEPKRYVMSNTTVKRCFDNEWLNEKSQNGSNCTYIPKNCSAKTYNYNGCGFSLPTGKHNQVFTAKNPTPFASQGQVEAYCWDGKWEIKREQCQLSCDTSVPSFSWNGTDPKLCSHTGKIFPSRLAPNSNVSVSNEVLGMDGTVTYNCKNGVLSTNPDFCQPKDCTKILAKTWGVCQHNDMTGLWKHGSTFSVPPINPSLNVNSIDPVYMCRYGNMELINNPSCVLRDVVCYDTGVTIPIVVTPACTNGILNNGKCCVGVGKKAVCINQCAFPKKKSLTPPYQCK